MNKFYKNDFYTCNRFSSYKLTVLLLLFCVFDVVLYKDMVQFYYMRLMHIIYTMAFLTTFAELMLMHVLTTCIRDKYDAINKHLHTKSVQADLNKTHLMDQSDVFIIKRLVIEDKKRKAKVIEQLMQEHFQLTAVAKKANKLFGLSILITLSTVFQTLTTCIYYVLYVITKNKNSQTINIVTSIWWGVPLIFYTLMLVTMWDSLAKEVRILLFFSLCNI